MSRVQRSYKLLLASMLVSQTVAITVVASTAWIMGPSGRGEVAFAQATATLLAVVGGWGFYLTAASTRQTPLPRQYFDLTIAFTASISIGLALLAILAPRGLLAPPVVVPVGFAAVMTAGTTYCARIAQARVSDLEYLTISVIPPIVSLFSVLPAVWLGAAPRTVIGIWSLGTAVGLLVGVAITRRSVPSERTRPWDFAGHIRSGFAVGAANVSSFLVMRADTFILGIMSTASQVGYYSVAAAMSGLMLYASEALSLRTISRYDAVADRDSYLAEAFQRARLAGALALGLGIPFLIAGRLALNLVFPQFRPAFAAFAVLCLAAAPASFVRVLVSAASMLGLSQLLARFSLVCYALLPIYVVAAPLGASALALASLLAYVAQAAFIAIGIHHAPLRRFLDRVGSQLVKKVSRTTSESPQAN